MNINQHLQMSNIYIKSYNVNQKQISILIEMKTICYPKGFVVAYFVF